MSREYIRSEARYMNVGKKEIPTPKYFCKTCNKCQDKRCQVFNRYVEENNRCFYHSNYSPIEAEFVSTVTMKDVIEEMKKAS